MPFVLYLETPRKYDPNAFSCSFLQAWEAWFITEDPVYIDRR